MSIIQNTFFIKIRIKEKIIPNLIKKENISYMNTNKTKNLVIILIIKKKDVK